MSKSNMYSINTFISKINTSKTLVLAGTLAFSCWSNSVEAQMAFAIGPKAGVSITSFSGDASDVKAKTSALGGLFLNWQIHPVFAIQPEFLLSQKGAVYTLNGNREDVRLKYFEVPILAKLRIPIGETVFPHILLGPNLAFNTNAQYTRVETAAGNTYVQTGDDVTKTDLGGLVGAGFDIQVKHLFLTLDGRYGYSFNNLGENAYNVRNVGWSFALGIGFRLGGGSGL